MSYSGKFFPTQNMFINVKFQWLMFSDLWAMDVPISLLVMNG